MARRYSRDNRGRFASGGTGATARGGRLKTASGKTRATQTTKAAAAKPSGTVAGKVKRNPAAAEKIGKAKAAAPKAVNKQRKTRQQKAEQTARIQATATKVSTNPAVSKSRALRNEQRAIRARKLNAIYKSPPIVEMSRGQKDRMIRVRREFGVKSTAQSPNFGSKAAAKPAKAAKPRRQVTETQLGNAAKRAKKVEISRYLSESDRMNAGGKETFAKRSAASQLRAEKGKRTSQAAKAFLSNYGTPSLFGQRPVSSTKDSPKFGSKKRKRR
jgi:hypothetical protein